MADLPMGEQPRKKRRGPYKRYLYDAYQAAADVPERSIRRYSTKETKDDEMRASQHLVVDTAVVEPSTSSYSDTVNSTKNTHECFQPAASTLMSTSSCISFQQTTYVAESEEEGERESNHDSSAETADQHFENMDSLISDRGPSQVGNHSALALIGPSTSSVKDSLIVTENTSVCSEPVPSISHSATCASSYQRPSIATNSLASLRGSCSSPIEQHETHPECHDTNIQSDESSTDEEYYVEPIRQPIPPPRKHWSDNQDMASQDQHAEDHVREIEVPDPVVDDSNGELSSEEDSEEEHAPNQPGNNEQEHVPNQPENIEQEPHEGNQAENREEPELPENQPAPPAAAFSELRKKLNGEYSQPINTASGLSPGEMLLMTLELAHKNKLTLKGFVDVLNLVNAIFGHAVLPRSAFLIQKLLNSGDNVERHFFCEKCFFYFGEKDHTVNHLLLCEVEGCRFENHIKDLTKATFFSVFKIPFQLELLFSNPEIRNKLLDPREAALKYPQNILSDLYSGSCYKKFVSSLPATDPDVRSISAVLCTDGAPVFSNSSSFSIWPLFLCVNELPPFIRMKNQLIGGLWFGNKKPPMDLFLLPVVKHLCSLSNPGFSIKVDEDVWKMKVFIIGTCVDSGARGAVQGINSHSGYYSCNWCEIPGERVGNSVKFPYPENVPIRRTHVRLIDQGEECLANPQLEYIFGVRGISQLVNLPQLDIVDGMVQDFAHNVPFGIARTFLHLWTSETEEPFYVGSPEIIGEFNARIKLLTPPTEIRRFPRPITESAHWKAREYENWILYFSIPVLIDKLPKRYLRHWNFLVQAVYLLLQDSVLKEHVDVAHKLLHCFAAGVEELYGKGQMTYNTHILTHLAQNVARWGAAWAVSTYCFEDAIGELKSIIHAEHGVPHQIERHLNEKEACKILKAHCSTPRAESFLEQMDPKRHTKKVFPLTNDCYLLGTYSVFEPENNERYLCQQFFPDLDVQNCRVYKKLLYRKCVYTSENARRSKKLNNSLALLVNDDLVIIKRIVLDHLSEKVLVFVSDVTCSSSIMEMPHNVTLPPKYHAVRVISSIGRRLRIIDVKDLKTVCVRSDVNMKSYITPVPNIVNIC